MKIGLLFKALCFFVALSPGLLTPLRVAAAEADEQDGELGLEADAPGEDDLDDDDLLDDELALLADEEVVESAARHRQDIGMSPSAITVITREDIATSGASNIPDLLRLVPGMDVVIASPFVTAINSRMHWTYENNTYLVLIDGREANFDLMGQAPWELLPISMEDIERIEVIRGPGSSLYGANAFAGVVSITTRAVTERHAGWVRVAGGEVGSLAADGRGSLRFGDFGLSVSGGYGVANSHSLPDERAKEVWRVRSLAEYRLSDKQRVSLEFAAAGGVGQVSTGAGAISGDFQSRSLALTFQGEDLKAQVFWNHFPTEARLAAPLEYRASPDTDPLPVARFVRNVVDLHSIDGQVQYTVPRFYEPLLIIVGAAARANGAQSDSFIDAETYLDVTSPRYQKPGIEYWGFRVGAFGHAEYAPADWVTLTAGVRYDYNMETDHFVSPRLTTVFRPAEGQFLRLGVARAFRKPSFMENRVHPMVEFPADSVLSAASQEAMQNMMTRVVGNENLDNEELWSFEAGYMGRFLDGALVASLDVYYSQLRNMLEMKANLVDDPMSIIIDFEASSFQFESVGSELDIVGLELALRWSPSETFTLLAAWSHREIYDLDQGRWQVEHPRNLLTLGGRFRTEFGLLGSLYLFARSEFTDNSIDSPNGLLDGYVTEHQPHVLLGLARLGYRYAILGRVELEAGVKLFLPLSPFEKPTFRYNERGGGLTESGQSYGGETLRRVVTGYLEGTF